MYIFTQGEDLRPLELKIDTLQKQISDSVERCTNMQGHWLRQQNELVRKSKEAEEETAAVDSLRKQQLILQQKKMRIDGKVDVLYMHILVKACTCTCTPVFTYEPTCTVYILTLKGYILCICM